MADSQLHEVSNAELVKQIHELLKDAEVRTALKANLKEEIMKKLQQKHKDYVHLESMGPGEGIMDHDEKKPRWKSVADSIILDYLIHNGYHAVAKAFASEALIDQTVEPIHRLPLEQLTPDDMRLLKSEADNSQLAAILLKDWTVTHDHLDEYFGNGSAPDRREGVPLGRSFVRFEEDSPATDAPVARLSLKMRIFDDAPQKSSDIFAAQSKEPPGRCLEESQQNGKEMSTALPAFHSPTQQQDPLKDGRLERIQALERELQETRTQLASAKRLQEDLRQSLDEESLLRHEALVEVEDLNATIKHYETVCANFKIKLHEPVRSPSHRAPSVTSAPSSMPPNGNLVNLWDSLDHRQEPQAGLGVGAVSFSSLPASTASSSGTPHDSHTFRRQAPHYPSHPHQQSPLGISVKKDSF